MVIFVKCTFFGHRDAPDSVKPFLYTAIESLIISNGVDSFYVGNNGNFDRMVIFCLKSLKLKYPHIRYFVILAYLPDKKLCNIDEQDTIYPEFLCNTPKKFAICKRNRWMIEQSDFVITYVKHHFGGAAQFEQIAINKNKKVINLFNEKSPS